jgi:hypothetical protein
MNASSGAPPRHARGRIVALSVAVAVLCVATIGLASWWYYYERPDSGIVTVQVWNSTPENESGSAEVWVAMNGPINGTDNPNMAALSVAPGATDRVSFPVAGEACQGQTVSLYLNVGSFPEGRPVSTQSVTVCGGESRSVAFTVTNTY